MKKKIDPSRLGMSIGKGTFAAALLVMPVLAPWAFGVSACAGDVSDGKSGETHFLCKTDDDCTKLGDGYVCAASYCARAFDAGSGGEGGSAGRIESGGAAGAGDGVGSGGSGGVSCLPCAEDRDCREDERCALSSCQASSSRCSPIAVAGPRGSWVSLEVRLASGPCPTVGGCLATLSVGPDGHVTGNSEGTPVDTMLTPAALDEFRTYVDGAPLRTALRDGLPCMDQMITDVDLTVTLNLSTGSLSKHANGCFATDNVLTRVYEVLSKL
jgi:hypothetical protein